MVSNKGHIPGWDYSFTSDKEYVCLLCHGGDRSLLTRAQPLIAPGETELSVKAGICESCAVHANWLWRLSSGEVPPDLSEEARTKVSKVKVLIAQRLKDKDAALPGSYEFVLARQPDGSLDLPGVDLVDGETEVDAATRALSAVELSTWPLFIEPLYKGYSPRGRLVSVVFVAAWSKKGKVDPEWRPWPLREHTVAGLSGFYWSLEDVWSMRLWKHGKAANATEEISVHVREAAGRYIELQQQLRMGKTTKNNPDVSMAEYLRRSMTDDEKSIDTKIRIHEERVMEIKTEDATPSMETVLDRGLIRSPLDLPTSPPEDDNEWPDDLSIQPSETVMEGEFHPIDEGFVRKGRVLTTKVGEGEKPPGDDSKI